MALRSWIRDLFSPRPRTVRNASTRWRPSVETLETREVPAALGFQPSQTTEGGYAVAVGDFNDDGKQDYATPDLTSGNIRVFAGNGDGTFHSAGQFASGGAPISVAVGDFNGDARPDLVTTGMSLWHDVGVLLGNGDGTFRSPVMYTVGGSPRSVAVGDFNGDYRLDLAVTGTETNHVNILLGNGDGTFEHADTFATGDRPTSVAVGDFNGDYRPDLVTANVLGHNVSVLLGNGDGTFRPAITLATGYNPNSVAVGDFDADGRTDLAVANSHGGTNSVSVFLGNGDGSFGPATVFGTGSGPYSVAVSDFDADGRADLVTANRYSNDVGVLLGNGDGTFDPVVAFAAGTGPLAVAVADLNGDTRPDLAAVSDTGVQVILNTTAATITAAQGSVTVNEGSPAMNSGTFSDWEGWWGTARLTASVGTVTKIAPGQWSWRYTPGDNLAAPLTVTVTVDYGGGLTAATSFTLSVRNVAPRIDRVWTSPARENQPVTLYASVTDPAGANDTLTYFWRVTRPDGTILARLTGESPTFVPPDNGTYGVSLFVRDDDNWSATSGIHPDLRGWWTGDLTAADSLGVNYAVLGSATYTGGPIGSKAFSFSGTNQVTVPDSPSLDVTTAVTLEAWISPSSMAFNNGFGAVIAKSSGAERNYGLFAKSNGGLHLSYFTTGGVNVSLETAANAIRLDKFSHVAATIDPAAGQMRIYVNGELVASRATAGPLVANNVPLTIGMSDPGRNYGFIGAIDDAAVYGRALNANEIRGNYSIGLDKMPGKYLIPITVANAAPTAWAGTSVSTIRGAYGDVYYASLTAGASDPSAEDQAAGFQYVINWGDGSAPQTIGRSAGNGGGVAAGHQYFAPGTYTITITAIDKDGGSHTITRTIYFN